MLTNKQMESRKQPRMGETKQKVLLLLFGGLALGLSRSPKQYFRIVKEIGREWKEINRQSLDRAVRSLYKSRLVEIKNNSNSTTTMILSKEGKKIALGYDIFNMKIKKPKNWDYRWRILMFDVPEKMKKIREAFRMHLKQMGFYEFQKSVFVHPYPCQDEFEYIVEFYNARRYMRFVVADEIDNVLELKKHFGLM